VSSLNKFEGQIITRVSGNDGGKVYYVYNNKKLWITSPEILGKLGLAGKEILRISDDEMEAILTGEPIVDDRSKQDNIERLFKQIGEIRYEFSRSYLKGRGIEIGAGAYPQLVPDAVTVEYFDLRSLRDLSTMFGKSRQAVVPVYGMDELKERFPDGADFLIAHQVLEHCPDPIGTLVDWGTYVRGDGIVVLSVPIADYCPDKGRLVPSVEHVILDYLFHRDADSFESREHAYSCIIGWMNTWEDWLPLNKENVAERAHNTASMKSLDMHWHSFTPELFDKIFKLASFFSENRYFDIIAMASPYFEGKNKTLGELLYVFQVKKICATGSMEKKLAMDPIFDDLVAVREKLSLALSELDKIKPIKWNLE